MDVCSVVGGLEIVKGSRGEYEKLCRFHYRDTLLGPYAAIYALKDRHGSPLRKGSVAGVIVYTTAAPNLELRNKALGRMFCGLGSRRDVLTLVNENIRCISRVIIEPRYRGLGLASMLVRETIGLAGRPVVEAMAVMGRVNPFFEKAGMTSYTANISEGAATLIEAFSVAGVSEDEFVDPAKVCEKIASLPAGKQAFINDRIGKFLQPYGKRKYMEKGYERMRYVLSKLTYRPVYYYWVREKGVFSS